jgi:hypothetical protein
MALAALLSLALLSGQADAKGFQTVPAPPPAEAPMATGQSKDDEARAAAAAEGEPIPSGAPTDDYGFVAWCSGALSEHMALRQRVWPDVERIEREFPDPATPVDQALAGYDEQQKEGEQQLAHFSKALDARDAKGRGGDRQAGVDQGRQVWRGSDAADTRQLAQLWMSWALPARCDSTAKKILKTGR